MLAKKIHCQAQLLISNNLIIHHPGYVLFIYQCTLFAVIYKFKLLELTLLMFSSLRHRWPKLILAILFMPFGFIAPKDFTIVCLSNILVSSIPDEGYSRNESCTLNLISTFLLYKRIHVVMLCTCILYPQVEVYIYMYDNFLRNNW